ncbi:MAG: hypothetical protein AMXMBFR64_09430 [Myxococcales bacterium]
MARIDLSRYGTKYSCYSCSCKFYDMNRGESVCPKCGANQKDAPLVDVSAMEALAIKPVRAPKPARPQRTLLDDVEEEEGERDEEVAAGEDDDFDFDEDLDFGDEPEIDDEDDEEEVP